jgi:hypothetical protein
MADSNGLVIIDDLTIAKTVVSSIAHQLPQEELLERIGHSRFPVELLQYLPHVYGSLNEQLRPVAELLLKSGEKYFDLDALRGFADVYWLNVVRERISNKDFSRAFDELKRAFRGMEAEETWWPANNCKPPVHGSPQKLAASLDCVCRLVQELHAAMYKSGVLPDILGTPRPLVTTKTGGILFATAIKGYSEKRSPVFTLVGLQTVAIAKYLNAQRSEVRKEKKERSLQAA